MMRPIGTNARSAGWVAVALWATACGGAASKDAKTPASSDKSEAPESTALAGGGFSLDFKIWQPEQHGDPKGLVASYKWGTAGARIVRAERENDRWHLEFPDQPKPQETASLDLHYEFALSEGDRTTIHEAARDVLRGVLEATRAAGADGPATSPAPTSTVSNAGKDDGNKAAEAATSGSAGAEPAKPPPDPSSAAKGRTAEAASKDVAKPAVATASPPQPTFEDRFAAAIKALPESDSANTLRKYGVSGGADGLAVVLKHLGMEVGDDGNWKQTAAGKQMLVDAARTWVDTNLEAFDTAARGYGATLARLTPLRDEAGCVVPKGDATALDEDASRKLLSACAAALLAHARTLDATAVPKTSDQTTVADKLAGAVTKLLAAKDVSFAAKQDLENDVVWEAKAVGQQGALASTYSYLATRLAETRLRVLTRKAEQEAQENVLLAGIDAAFEHGTRLEDGATLVSGAARPRRYDVATGVVYVAGLDDVIVPTLISICPSDGCLAADDVAWTAKNGWLRALSFDAGVRVKTLDTQDLRQSDKLSFLLGVSFNPVTVLRVSGGFYAYENAQNQRWNGQGYVGVTLNVLNAATLFGSLGMGDPVAPKTTEVH